ncbi:MAG: hypothetical protein ACMXYG_02510 [Candidatus Woesearchaeota archaeon]
MGWFKKKEELPPLPEELPPIEDVNTHDQIPNDFDLNQNNSSNGNINQDNEMEPINDNNQQQAQDTNYNPSIEDEEIPTTDEMNNKQYNDLEYVSEHEDKIPDYHKDNLNDSTQYEDNNSENQRSDDELPDLPEPSEPQLPEIPEVPDVDSNQKEPTPDNEKVPEPPAIFSDEGFYNTPEEVKHLVEEKKVQRSKEKDFSYEAPGITHKEEILKRTVSGPIFVDIDAFKAMLGDIDTIKNDMKASSVIIQHLDEIKNSKDRELERWRLHLDDIHKKINYVDKILFNEA